MGAIKDVQHTLWICGRPWSVRFCGESVLVNGREALGDCREDTFVIRVAGDTVSRLQQRTTLLHEWLHACLKTNSVPDPRPSDDEEAYVRSLEVTIYDSLRDSRNAWFRTFLLESDKILVPLHP